jgi:ABC-2 type transport system permease protein
MKVNTGRQFGQLFIANFKTMFREKQVWFWQIFFPIILMSIFMMIFGGSGNSEFHVKVAAVGETQNRTAAMMHEMLRQIPVFEWQSESPVSVEQADEWIKNKEIEGAIVLPTGDTPGSIRLIVHKEAEGNATTQALRGILEQVVSQANLAAAGVQPAFAFEFHSVSAGSEELSYEDFLMTGMLGLALGQGGLFGMVDMVELRRKGLLKRLRMTPMRMGLMGLSGMLIRFVLGIFQMVCLVLIGVFVFGANVHIDFATLLVAFLIGSLAFNAMGYLISSFSKTVEAYMGIANLTNFLMMFISGIFFPVNSMPEWLQSVSKFLPLKYFVDVLRDGLVYASGLAKPAFWFGIGVIALWGACAYVLGALLYRRTKIEVR